MQYLSNNSSPANSEENILSVTGVNLVHKSKFFDFVFARKTRVKSAYFPYLIVCQFCIVMSYSVSIAATSLGYAVPNVVSPCSQEQMLRIDAGRVVATMKHTQITRNRPIVVNPNEAMADIRMTVASHTSVSRGIFRTDPVPAISRPFDTIPKSFPEISFEIGVFNGSGLIANFNPVHATHTSLVINRKEG